MRALVPEHFVVRVGYVYGGGADHLTSAARALAAGEPAGGLVDRVGSPTYVQDLAAATAAAAPDRPVRHLSPGGARRPLVVRRADPAVSAIGGVPGEVQAADLPRARACAAPRPAYSALTSVYVAQLGVEPMPPLEDEPETLPRRTALRRVLGSVDGRIEESRRLPRHWRASCTGRGIAPRGRGWTPRRSVTACTTWPRSCGPTRRSSSRMGEGNLASPSRVAPSDQVPLVPRHASDHVALRPPDRRPCRAHHRASPSGSWRPEARDRAAAELRRSSGGGRRGGPRPPRRTTARVRIAVLHPQTAFVRGGAETHAEALVRALSAAGHDADLVQIAGQVVPGRASSRIRWPCGAPSTSRSPTG